MSIQFAPRSTVTAVVASFLLAASTASTAHAQNIFDDFSSGNDSPWFRLDGPAIYAGIPSTYSVTNGQYRIQQPAYNPAFGTLPVGSHRVDSFALDSQISVDITDWSDSTNNVIGVSARLSQPTSSSFQYYTLAFFPTSGAGSPGNPASNLRIDRWNANGSTTSITAFSANAFPRVNANDTYRLVFTLAGSTLTGELFNISGPLPTLVRSITGTDTGPGALGAGIPGIGIYANGSAGPADVTFDNFRVVPSPGASLILGLSGVLAGRRRR